MPTDQLLTRRSPTVKRCVRARINFAFSLDNLFGFKTVYGGLASNTRHHRNRAGKPMETTATGEPSSLPTGRVDPGSRIQDPGSRQGGPPGTMAEGAPEKPEPLLSDWDRPTGARKKLFVLLSYCWRGHRQVWTDQTEAFGLTACLNQSPTAYPGSIGA